MRRPDVTVDVHPVLGPQDSNLNLKSLPKVSSVITEVVEVQISNLIYPNKLYMMVPCVMLSPKIDRDGNVIPE